VSEQISTAGPDGGEQRPSDGKTRKGLVVGILGGFLTAGAVVLALNGGPPFIKKDPTLSVVAPAEITDASRTLDPTSSEQMASRAKECAVPLAQVAIWKTPGASGGTIRIRSLYLALFLDRCATARGNSISGTLRERAWSDLG
jgi:hypothetical protein